MSRWKTRALIVLSLLMTPCGRGEAQTPRGTARKWSPAEQAFLDAWDEARNPDNIAAQKTYFAASQKLLDYYMEGDQQSNPCDLDRRIQWYEGALRTGQSLFDKNLDQRQRDLVRQKNETIKLVEEVSREKDIRRRLAMLNSLGCYKPYLDAIAGVEKETAEYLFDEYKKMPAGESRAEFLKSYNTYAGTSTGSLFFALVYQDSAAEIKALLQKGQGLNAGALADMALQFWPADVYLNEIARKTIENF